MLNESDTSHAGAPQTKSSVGPEQTETFETFTPNWAPDAPRGGRAVLTRILKELATVPLFLAQTFVQSLRDVGYNTTTSALEEHVDNAIEACATEIRVFFHQTGGRGNFETGIMVYDNGRGMAPNVLKVATAFGGSLSYGNRSGIGRFGMGMKTAALSMSPVMELYSWQSKGRLQHDPGHERNWTRSGECHRAARPEVLGRISPPRLRSFSRGH